MRRLAQVHKVRAIVYVGAPLVWGFMRNRRIFLVLAIGLAAPHAALASLSISKQPTLNVSCAAGVCAATSAKAILNAGDLLGMLASGDVTLESTSIAKDIEIHAPLSWTSASRLTFDSYRSITFNKPLIVAGAGALTITTNDGGAGGDFRFFGKGHVEFQNTSDSLSINGRNYVLVESIKDLRVKVRHNDTGAYALAKHITSRHAYTDSPIGAVEGILEGLGNTISGLTINSSGNGHTVAFISELVPGAGHSTGIVRDIGLKDVQITGTGFEECIGALVGVNQDGTIENAYATGSITATASMSIAGGLVCDNVQASVRESSSEVNVVGADNSVVGGLAGLNEGACSGSCDGLVDQSFSAGPVTGGDGGMVGGLIGRNIGGTLTNSYATGSTAGGNSAFVGGLVGSNEDNTGQLADAVIMNVYSTGLVSGGSSSTVGGLVGQDIAAPGISHAYWDLDTSGISDPHQGAGNVANDHGITGVTDAQLKSALPAGFDKQIWGQDPSINNGYPYLLSNPPQ